LHIVQIERDFNRIALAYLIDRLYIRPVYQLKYLLLINKFGCVGTFKLLQLLLLLILILVHPEYSLRLRFNNVHFVVGAVVFLDCAREFQIGAASADIVFHHVLNAPFCEFVFETCF